MDFCVICKKKLGGFNGKHSLGTTGMELCTTCMGKVKVMETSLTKIRNIENLPEQYEKTKTEIDELTEDINVRNLLNKYFNTIYMSKNNQYNKKEKEKHLNEYVTEKRSGLSVSIDKLEDVVKENYANIDFDSVIAINPQYEYDVVVIQDKLFGSTNVNELKTTLIKYSLEGWRLVHIFTNEIGKNGAGASSNSIGFGLNSTIDETILIFERMLRKPLQ